MHYSKYPRADHMPSLVAWSVKNAVVQRPCLLVVFRVKLWKGKRLLEILHQNLAVENAMFDPLPFYTKRYLSTVVLRRHELEHKV